LRRSLLVHGIGWGWGLIVALLWLLSIVSLLGRRRAVVVLLLIHDVCIKKRRGNKERPALL
jgi:hypothetical protein